MTKPTQAQIGAVEDVLPGLVIITGDSTWDLEYVAHKVLTAAAEVGGAVEVGNVSDSYKMAMRREIAATIERCAQEKIDALARIYRVNVAAAAAVALVCDEQLDRSGALLQKIRDEAEIQALIQALRDRP